MHVRAHCGLNTVSGVQTQQAGMGTPYPQNKPSLVLLHCPRSALSCMAKITGSTHMLGMAAKNDQIMAPGLPSKKRGPQPPV